MNFDELLRKLSHPRRATKDVYRLGDPDFDARREQFYENCRYAFTGEPVPAPVVLPLIAFYGFERDTMKRRAEFYANCARVFGWKEWELDKPEYAPHTGTPGRDGKVEHREKYGEAAKASYWDHHAGTVELFERKADLLDSIIVLPYSDEKRDLAARDGNTRRRVARMVRDLFDGEMVSNMQSADLGGVPGGTFAGKVASDHALDCQAKVHQMRKDLPPRSMAILEDVIRREVFLWEVMTKTKDGELVPDRKKSKRILQDIRMALDFAAWSLGASVKGREEISKAELCERWPTAVDWFYQQKLRPAVHSGRVIRKAAL